MRRTGETKRGGRRGMVGRRGRCREEGSKQRDPLSRGACNSILKAHRVNTATTTAAAAATASAAVAVAASASAAVGNGRGEGKRMRSGSV